MCADPTRWLLHGLLAAAIAVGTADRLLAAGQTSDQENEDPIFGRWTLVVSKSKYTPGPKPKSQTRIYEAHPQGVKTTINTVGADGLSATVEYVAQYDSIQYPVTGSAEVHAIALRKIDAYTAEATLAHAGKQIGTARRVISKDGKTMTISFRDMAGTVNNLAVYEKVEK